MPSLRIDADPLPMKLSATPAAWYDASDQSSIKSYNASGRVSVWMDKSGNGKHAYCHGGYIRIQSGRPASQGLGPATYLTEPTTALNTIGGLNVVSVLNPQYVTMPNITIQTNCSVYAVMRNLNPTPILFPASAVTFGNQDLWDGNGANFSDVGGSQTAVPGGDSYSWCRVNRDFIYCPWLGSEFYSRTASKNCVVVSEKLTFQNWTQPEWFIGGYHPAGLNWSGWIGELIFFNTTLPAAERTRLETYLMKKWAIQAV